MEKGWAQRNMNLRKLQYDSAQNGSVPKGNLAGPPVAGAAGQSQTRERQTDALGELLVEFRKQNEHLKHADAVPKERG